MTRRSREIGIYLGYRPNQQLGVQGLGRLLAFILTGMVQVGRHPVIGIGPWAVDELRVLLATVGLKEPDYRILTTGRMPALLVIKDWIRRLLEASRRSRPRSLRARIRRPMVELDAFVLAQTNFVTVVIAAVLCSPIIVLLGIALLALHVITTPLRILSWFREIPPWPSIKDSGRGSRTVRFVSRLREELRGSAGPESFTYLTYTSVLARVKNKLIKRMNSTSSGVSAWLVPGIFWEEVVNIKGRVVVAVPDLVYHEFPSMFLDTYWNNLDAQAFRITGRADAVISYSPYVLDRHVVDYLGVDRSRAHVIRHAPIDLGLDLADNVAALDQVALRERAIAVLQDYQEGLDAGEYLSDFDFTGARFIFYSSQYRPHKNMINLVKAVEKLVREHSVDLKLALTANPERGSPLTEFVHARRMEHDVIFFHSVEPPVLAALNALAICSVNPTLFEGGFPFTFAEAFSVGTPSVMSDIRVVTDEIEDPELRRLMLFDPHDFESIAERIMWAIGNRRLLLDLQAPLYKAMTSRSWAEVAQDYLDILEAPN